MIKKHLKRGLSLLLALVLVVTTFFIFDPDLLRVESDAYVDVESAEAGAFLSSQTLYATETIYLQTGTSAFQYYENYSYATGAVASPVDTSGNVYFKNDDATAVSLYVNNVYDRSSKAQVAAGSLVVNSTNISAYAGMADGSATRSAGTLVTSVSGGVLDYDITAGSLSGWTEGEVYIIEWLVEYTINGAAHYAFAYTGIYAAPDDQAGITTAGRQQNGDATSHTYSFVTGGHKVSGGNAYSAITDTSGSTKRNPLLGFVGQRNNSTSYTIAGGSGLYQLGSSYFPAKAGGGVAAQSFEETSCGGSANAVAGTVNTVTSNHITESSRGAITVGTYDSPNAQGTLLRSFSDNYSNANDSSRDYNMMTGVSYLLVDTSRYTNYNQIPNFKVGFVQFYSYRGTEDNYLSSIRICNDTGTAVDGNYSVSGVDTSDAGDSGTSSVTRGLYSINGTVTNGLKFAYFTHTIERSRTFGNHRMNVNTNVGFHTTTWNQATLRSQYNEALCTYIDYYNITNYASAYAETYKSGYYENLKAVGEELADPTAHSVSSNNDLTTFVENCTKAIASGSAPEVHFYVPEVIYIDPIQNGSGTHNLQYYVDRENADNGKLNQDGEKTNGNIYFHATNAVKVTSLSYRRMEEYGGSSVNLSIGQTSSSSGTLSTTMTGTIDAYATTYIEWTVEYVNRAGQTLTAHAYSCCYPSMLNGTNHNGVISSTSGAGRSGTRDGVITTTGWIVGAHSVDANAYIISSTSAGTGTNTETGVDWDHYGAYVSNYLQNRSTIAPTDGSETDPAFDALYNTGLIGGSGYWASNGSVDYPNGGKGTIFVDSSRYTNLNQIPNLYVGVDANNADKSDNTDAARHMYLNAKWYGGTDTELTKQENLPEIWGGQSGARKVAKLNAAVTPNATDTKTVVLTAHGVFDLDGRNGYSSCYLVCNFRDLSPIRTAYDNAIKKSQYLQEEYFTASEWATYENILILQAALNIIYPSLGSDQATIDSIAKSLNAQVDKMVSAVTATGETYTYTDANGNEVTGNRADILNTGKVTVHHKAVDLDENGNVLSVTDIGADETASYYYGETVNSGYNEYDGYNYFGYYRNEGTAEWTASLGTSALTGDMAAQGTYGTSGHNTDQFVNTLNLTYTYVYSKVQSGVYMDHGASDNAFENKANLADITGVDINTAYTGDGTYYSVDTTTTVDNGGNYVSGAAMVSKADNDGFNFSILSTGYNTATPKAEGLTNCFDLSASNFSGSNNCTVSEINYANGSFRTVSTGTDGYCGGWDGFNVMKLIPGHSYSFSFDYQNNNSTIAAIQYFLFTCKDANKTYANDASAGYPQINASYFTPTTSSGTYTYEFTVPTTVEGYVSLRLGTNTSGADVTFSNIRVYDLSASSQYAKMNDIFLPNIATGLEGGKTYTVSFESSLRYDDYRWYAVDMYGVSTPDMDWAHDQGTIQMFISTTSGGDELANYTVPVRVTTDISTGGTIGTFELPAGCSNINLGFCITNDTPLAGWVDNIRITEGDFVEVGEYGDNYTLPDPVWEGYTFTGWSEGSAPFYGTLASPSYTFGTESDTVIADWKINEYDITFDNEFVFDDGWTDPDSTRGSVSVDTDENSFTLKTLDNSTFADNTILSKNIIDIVPGHRYRVSFDYDLITSVGGDRVQVHFFYFENLEQAQSGSWKGFPGDGTNAVESGGVYTNISGRGTASIEFVVPSGYEYARVRLGNCNINNSVVGQETTFSDIYVQDITRGTTAPVHDTTVSEPYVTEGEQSAVLHGVVRNYKEALGGNDLTALPEVSSELFDFAGWYTGKNGTGSEVTLNDLTEAKTNQKWSHWTVHLDYLIDSETAFKDEAQAPVAQTGLAIGSTAVIDDYVPYKVGYNFAGWYSSYEDVTYQPGDTVTLNHNIKLTPVWVEATEVTKETDYAEITQLHPGQIYFYKYTPAKNEYVSSYVYGATPDLTVSLYDGDTVTQGNTNYTYGVSDLDSMVTGGLTGGETYYYGITGDITSKTEVTGNFKISEHYINYTLDAAGGSVSATTVTGYYNTETALETPVRTGYTFSGWLNEDRNTVWQSAVSAEENSTIITGNTAAFVTEAKLVAQWNLNSYDLTAHAYYNEAASSTTVGTTYSLGETGGYVTVGSIKSSGGTATEAVVYNTSAKYTATPATGYTFAGWYSSPTIADGVITDWGTADSTDTSVTISNMGAENKTVYAKFDINTYDVIIYAYSDNSTTPGEYALSLDGGTVSLDGSAGAISATQKYVHGQSYTMTAVANTGYAFQGWYYGENDITTGSPSSYDAVTTVTVTEAHSYKARFDIQKYQLSINANGGTAESGSYTDYMGVTITIPEPTKDGYTFAGWTIVDDATSGTANGTLSGNDYTFGGGNDRATANWTVNNYPVTIDPNGGEVTVNYYYGDAGDVLTQTVTASTAIDMAYGSTASLHTPTRTGYEFTGWTVSGSTGEIVQDTGGNATTYKVGLNDTAVITAQWEVKEYPINVYAWGDAINSEGAYSYGLGGTVKIGTDGTAGVSASGYVNYGETATIIAAADTGYTFIGWQTTLPSGGLNTISTDAEYTTAQMTENGLEYYAVFGINQYDVTLEAVYNTVEDPNTFNKGTTGGTVTGDGTYSHGESATLKATPATGYTFKGWYNSEDAEVYANPTYTVTVEEAIALTAKFTVSEYTVSTLVYSNTAINLNSFLINESAGTVTGETKYYHGQTTSLTATANTGYKFVGWYSDSTLTTQIGDGTAVLAVPVTATSTYYAKFEVVEVEINLNAMSNADNLADYTLNDVGGTVSYDNSTYAATASGKCYYGGNYTVYAKPAAGYQFDGWYSDSTLTTLLGTGNYHSDGYFDFSKIAESADGESLYAKFSVGSYSLTVYAYSNSGTDTTYYANNNVGGTVGISGTFLAGSINTAESNGAYAAVNVYFDKTATITATANIGYIFDGWYTDASFANSFNANNEVETAPMVVDGLAYYAKFTVGSFTVIYDANGGTEGSVKSGTAYYNTQFIIDAEATPEARTGYLFMGWSVENPAATSSDYASGAAVTANTVSDWYRTYGGNSVTLYAVWVTSANTIIASAAYSKASGVYYMGTEGGTVEVVAKNPEDFDEENNQVVVPLGAAVEDYLVFTPAAGYTFRYWRYSLHQSDVPAENAQIGTNWCTAGTGTTTMPSQPIFVVGYFEIQTFSAKAYAYYNTAADAGSYTYGATGGTVKLGTTGTNASNAISENVNYGDEVLFVATAAKGYSFVGWYKTPVIDNGIVTRWGEPVTTDVQNYVTVEDNTIAGNETANDYYAVFAINSYNATASVRTYTVREDLVYSLTDEQWPGGNPSNNGGNVGIGLTATSDDTWRWTQTESLNPTIKGVYYGVRVYFAAQANTGYTFGGWYSTKDAEYYGEDLVEETELTYSRIMREGDIYMEAKFVPVSFTLVLDANGGVAGNPTEIVLTFGESFKIADTSIPTNTGSNFKGWADALGSTEAQYQASETITPDIVAAWYKEIKDTSAPKRIYAVWETAHITVEFDKQGATGGDNSVSITVGSTLPDLESVPEYEGFVFGGYYSEAGGVGTPYYDADGKATEQPWNNTSGGTIYALWTCPVLTDITYNESTDEWTYTYQDEQGGSNPVTSSQAATSVKDITELAKSEDALMWWTLNVDTLNTDFVEDQIEKTPSINLNHYTSSALQDLRAAVIETNSDDELNALTQPQANAYVARMAKDMELDYAENKKTETDAPSVTLYENAEKVNLIKSETILEAADSANGTTYAYPSSSDAASYAYAGKWSYTAEAAVDYYLYTNSANPVIALEIGDGEVATSVADNNSSYPTNATITDNSAGFGYVTGNHMTSAVKATDDLDNAWFTEYTTAGIGTAHDYNAKTVIYLTPEFTSSGTQNEIVYTITPTDDAYDPNEGVSEAMLGGSNANLQAKYQSYMYNKTATTGEDDITICICYHNSMNGDSDEGTLDASGTYMQMYMDQVQEDEWLNQLHLFRTSGGASNWEFPTTTESVYPVEDSTYPYSEIGCTLGSFIYVFDATNEATATSCAEAGDYASAKQAIIDSVKGKAGTMKEAIADRSNALNINGNDTGLGVFEITGWSCNFYPKTGSYVYAHLVDRWGNVFNRVWKCYNVDSYKSTINATDTAAVYSVFEDGGSNIDSVTLDGANVEFILDENSTYENGVFTTNGNTVKIATGEANKTYSLTVTDNATNTNTVEVTTDGDGVLVLNVEDAQADLSAGAYTFTLNGETVNLYAGVNKLILSASITSVSLVGSETVVTVKTSKDTVKVQLVEGTGTRTYTPAIADSVVENEDGTLTWTLSFKASLGTHTYAVKGRTVDGWQDSDVVVTTEIVTENVSSPTALKSVYNAEVVIGESPVIKARTQAGTEKLQLVYANGGTRTYNRSEDIIITTVDNVETWVLTGAAYSEAGEYEVTVRAKYNGEWQDDNTKISTVTVIEEVVDTTPEIYSVEAQSSSVRVGEYTTFKVLTNDKTVKIRFNYPDGTTWTFNESAATIVDNGDGTKTWTVSLKLYTLGENDINFSAKSVSGWVDGQSFGSIEVTK